MQDGAKGQESGEGGGEIGKKMDLKYLQGVPEQSCYVLNHGPAKHGQWSGPSSRVVVAGGVCQH